MQTEFVCTEFNTCNAQTHTKKKGKLASRNKNFKLYEMFDNCY